MTYGLIIGLRESDYTWPVYELRKDPIRTEGSIAYEMDEPIGHVASWAQLDAIATERGVLSDQIDGDGFAEMEKELGPKP